MKKFFSAVVAVLFAASVTASGAAEVTASYVYSDLPVGNNSHYCIVKLADDPMAKYSYAMQNGVDDFIFTDEGQAVYEDLISDHKFAQQSICALIGRNVERIYDYTAVYNGFSILVNDSEYDKIITNKDSFGIENIYKSDYYNGESSDSFAQPPKRENSYSDITDNILDQTGVSNVKYKGDSTVIAIIDSEFDTDHEFLSTMPENAKGRLDAEFIDGVSPFLSATNGNGEGYYLNEKIPYRFNYSKHNTDTKIDSDNFHGTHVAGIAAGNGAAETDKKFDPKGVAPDAQLLLMSSDLTYYCLMAAYDDCAYLGADTINASYGEDFATIKSAPFEAEAITNLTASGTMFCAASGNAGKIDYVGDDSLLNPDYATGGTPEGISSVFTVGSAANTVEETTIITVGDKNYRINPGSVDITTALGDVELEMEFINGKGYPEDFDGIDLKGKIAFIERGEITFDEKAENAKNNGAVGVIFSNNVKDDDVTIQCSVLPSGIVSLEDSIEIISSGEKKVKIYSEKQLIISTSNKMNGFSAWGYTEKLLLKPDITAYGGNILSSYPNNKYGFMSGTSMSAPQATGMTALLKEYLKNNKEKYGIESDSDYSEIIADLLMSTAIPIYSSDGMEIASPRIQGSGLANVENAINTPVYLYTDSETDNFRPKLSLGDNLQSNIGKIEFSTEKFCFHVKNISDKPQTYTLSADLFRDDVSEDGLSNNIAKMSKSKVKFKSLIYDINEITVAPGEDALINLDIDLYSGDINFIEENFKNGTFIDGFVYLKSDSAPDLTLPFTGFYGSWNDADIFEPFVYSKNITPSMYPSLMCDNNFNTAGINSIAVLSDELIVGNPVYSPNGDNILDRICIQLGFKRRCENVRADIIDNETGKSIYTEKFILNTGSWSSDENQEPITTPYPINWDFEGASENKIYRIKLTAEKPLNEEAVKHDIISQEFTIDITPPEVKECIKVDVNGNDYLLIKASDNNAVQGSVMVLDDEVYSSSYSKRTNAKEYYSMLELPKDNKTAFAEVYDMAGNCVTVGTDEIADTYTLRYDENMRFSTNNASFRDKITLTDSRGNKINFTTSSTPASAYKEGITEISLSINSQEIVSGIPISVGLAGDADLNGTVNLYDAIKIAKYMIWKVKPNGSFKNEFIGFEGSLEECLADFDVNGSIDIYDAVGIAKSLLKATN